jgi:hypothetical protein
MYFFLRGAYHVLDDVKHRSKTREKGQRGCLVSLLFQKILDFGLPFYIMKLNIMQIFDKNVVILHFRFWPKERKKPKRASRGPHEDNKHFGWN